MTWAGEDDRAIAYRQEIERRHAGRRQREAQLAGNASARTDLAAAWAGFLQWLIERREAQR